jgi:hypothetical protein
LGVSGMEIYEASVSLMVREQRITVYELAA